jgi:hypothetical protein
MQGTGVERTAWTMKKTQTSKLVLAKQSIRTLTSDEAAHAVGGTSTSLFNTGMTSSAEAIITTGPRITRP